MFPERIVPDEEPEGVVSMHLARYEFARTFVVGKRVADVACGVGYGSYYLASWSRQVVGVDVDGTAVAYASRRYSDLDNVAFIQADALNLGLAALQFDAVCSFETVEHLVDAENFLAEVKRILIPGGHLIISTPMAHRSTSNPANPYHVQEWCADDFKQLLEYHFDCVELYSQLRRKTRISHFLKRLDVFRLRAHIAPLFLTRQIARIAGVRATPDLQMSDVLVLPGSIKGASEVVAIAYDDVSREES